MEQDARRRLQYSGHSGYSEDSDYTSELNYPVGQHPNSSASQFRGVASQMRTPGSSRENSWDDGGRYQHGYQQGYQDGYQGYDKNDPTYGSGYYDTPNRSLESSRENSYEREDGAAASTTAYQQGFEEGRRRFLLAQQRAQFGGDQTGECRLKELVCRVLGVCGA
ncbi:hypothetical protein ONE63_002372 [Megalurothrips usitatus]|uniref:Uncharacterized protein n=1 Tax=Megalurothrips usitatus TaxID=439358 RepID=A0AAV7XC12_9NEOP|nr:hypothetical protein ONE63_002372 [Megalurothrips usitatus]